MKAGEYVQMIMLKQTEVLGQGEAPKNMKVVVNNTEYLFPFGGVFKISTKCDAKNNIAELNNKQQYPLVNIKFVKANKDLFAIIKNKKEK